ILFILPWFTCIDLSNSKCIRRWGGIELDYYWGETTAWTVNLCDVVTCGKQGSKGEAVYLCWSRDDNLKCNHNTDQAAYKARPCNKWENVIRSTHVNWDPTERWATREREKWHKLNIQRDNGPINNLITIALEWQSDPNGEKSSAFFIGVGVDVNGNDPVGWIKVRVTDKPTIDTGEATKNAIDNNGGDRPILGADYSTWTTEQIVKLSTGFEGSNLWIKWINAQAREANMDGCVACAAARPALFLGPAPLFPTEDPIGFQCMINLTRMANPANCTVLSNIFPVIANNTGSGPFQIPDSGNFTCFNHTAGDETKNPKHLGNINPNWCRTIFNGDSGNFIGPWARAGLYYYCGGSTLLLRLPMRSQGLCAMVRLISPITMYGAHKTISNYNRPRRSDDYDFDLTKNTPTYIDAIGVPRGVPDEHKLVHQIAAGWESILIWITPNKNVDRINYVNYQVMRLANITGAAITGLSEQLSATSLMTIQNRIALDMVLANQGGVCHMFGDVCCTVIPNNTAPDGKVTKALIALKALSREMAENTGVDNPITKWLERTFGQWKGVFISMASAIAVFAAILVTCGCCCVPCIRSLKERIITRMMEGKDDKPPYMLPILECEEEQEELL
uniref:Envelope glycoprotein n=1 Tax=Astyanax mexicanus TaxID=7994 RepID=A0A3B1IVS4_ASTMX